MCDIRFSRRQSWLLNQMLFNLVFRWEFSGLDRHLFYCRANRPSFRLGMAIF